MASAHLGQHQQQQRLPLPPYSSSAAAASGSHVRKGKQPHSDPNAPLVARSSVAGSSSSSFVSGGKEKRNVASTQMSHARRIFSTFDKNNDGCITRTELKAAVDQMGLKLGKKEFEELFDTMDKNEDGTIDFEEYNHFMETTIEKSNEKIEVEALFRVFADQRVGKISISSLKRGAQGLHLNFSDSELQDMIDLADTEDGLLNLDDFEMVAKRTGLFKLE